MAKKKKWTENSLLKMRFVTDSVTDPLINQVFADLGSNPLALHLVDLGIRWWDGPIIELPPLIRDFLSEDDPLPSWVDPYELDKAAELFREKMFLIMCILLMGALPKFLLNEVFSRALIEAGVVEDPPLNPSDPQPHNLNVREWSSLMAKAIGIIRLILLVASKQDGLGVSRSRSRLAIRRIRLHHSITRLELHRRGWDNVNGEPINQAALANAQTALAMGVIRGFYRLDIGLSEKEKKRILLVWNVIAYYLGVDESLIPLNLDNAHKMNQVCQAQQYKATQNSVDLTHELLVNVVQNLLPFRHSVLGGCMRAVAGGRVGDKLQIPENVEWSFFFGIFLSASHGAIFKKHISKWIDKILHPPIPGLKGVEFAVPQDLLDHWEQAEP